MKESAWGYLIVMLGVIIITILIFIQRLTTTNEEEYYMNRETLRAAMIDAVDYSALHGDDPKLIMVRDKFVEIFTRRFAESATPDKTYELEFYQIVEEPPSATVRIRSYTGTTNIGRENVSELNVAVDNTMTAVLVMDDDGKVHARPPEQDEFVSKSNVYWSIEAKRDRKYMATNNIYSCKSQCDVSPNASLNSRPYNFLEFSRKAGSGSTVYIRNLNYVKAKYKSNINLVTMTISSYVRYSSSDGSYVYNPVYLLYRNGHDVEDPSDELEYVFINFTISSTANGEKQTFEAVFKPDPSGGSEYIAVDEYRTDIEDQRH